MARNLKAVPLPDAPTVAEQVAKGTIDAPDGYNKYPSPAKPLDVSRRLVADVFTRGGGKTLRWFAGTWYMYTGTHFQEVHDELDVRAHMWHRLSEVTYANKDGAELPWPVETGRLNGLMEPLKILTRLPVELTPPFHTAGPYTPARDVIAMSNGILNYRTRELKSSTPELFTTWALPFKYDEEATCNTWTKFLNTIFAHDQAAIRTLQEFFGMYISGRMDLQKALILIGPSRAGKGTISRTLQALMGGDVNCASPGLAQLNEDFGLEGLIDKPLAVIEDARTTGRNDRAVERLLGIIGEDNVSINRKGKAYWQGKLPARFLIVSNELPAFADASKAITTRFMAIRLTQSFVGKEDHDLGTAIMSELPGILNWALDGLDRLEDNNTFTRPATMDDTIAQMEDLASPLTQFADEHYTITGNDDDRLTVSEVHGAYKAWCQDSERKPMNRENFINKLTAAYPSLTYKNTALGGMRKTRWLFGIKKDELFQSP